MSEQEQVVNWRSMRWWWGRLKLMYGTPKKALIRAPYLVLLVVYLVSLQKWSLWVSGLVLLAWLTSTGMFLISVVRDPDLARAKSR